MLLQDQIRAALDSDLNLFTQFEAPEEDPKPKKKVNKLSKGGAFNERDLGLSSQEGAASLGPSQGLESSDFSSLNIESIDSDVLLDGPRSPYGAKSPPVQLKKKKRKPKRDAKKGNTSPISQLQAPGFAPQPHEIDEALAWFSSVMKERRDVLQQDIDASIPRPVANIGLPMASSYTLPTKPGRNNALEKISSIPATPPYSEDSFQALISRAQLPIATGSAPVKTEPERSPTADKAATVPSSSDGKGSKQRLQLNDIR